MAKTPHVTYGVSLSLMSLLAPLIIFYFLFQIFMPEADSKFIYTFAFSYLLLNLGVQNYSTIRKIDDKPTLKIKGAFIGLVEVVGTAESEKPLTSLVTGTKCVYYSWSIEVQKLNKSWHTLDHGEETSIFYLKDETGIIRIDPDKAQLITESFTRPMDESDPLYKEKVSSDIITHSAPKRVTENLIPLHRALYVMGKVRERQDIVATEIAFDLEDPYFFISTKGEKSVRSLYRIGFLALVFFGFILTIASSWSLETSLTRFIAFNVIYVDVLILSCVWIVYNSLINLRNEVDRAWSLIDIQLKRRSDLIPNLVKVIEGYREHEEYIQVQVAELRKQVLNPETPMGVASLIQSIAEAYPDLKAEHMFIELQRSLDETEQRIALTREYYNQLIRFYNTRIEVFPDRYIANLRRLKQRPYWAAENFQQAQEKIDFAS